MKSFKKSKSFIGSKGNVGKHNQDYKSHDIVKSEYEWVKYSMDKDSLWYDAGWRGPRFYSGSAARKIFHKLTSCLDTQV